MTTTDTHAELQRFRDSIGSARPRRRRPWIAAAAAGAVVATAATIGLLATGDDASPQVVQVAGTVDAPAPLPPSAVQDEIAASGSFGDAAYPAAGALWRLASETSVDRIDPESGEVTTVPLPVTAAGPFVEAGGLVWFPGVDADGQAVFALDPQTGEVARRSERLTSARFVGSGPAGLWAVSGLRELSEIDPETGEVLRTVTTEQGVYDVHVGEGVVYAGAYASGTGITVVDTATGSTRIVLPEVAPGPVAMADDGDLWIHDGARGALVRVDGRTFEQQAVIELGLDTSRGAKREFGWTEQQQRMRITDGWGDHAGVYPVVSGDVLYAAYAADGTARVLTADAATGQVAGVVDLGPRGVAGPLTVADGSLWSAWRQSEVVQRLALLE